MQLHASCVAFDGRAVLIRGPSGSGKSALALSLMAIGAQLVADDRTSINSSDGWPVASAPDQIRGLIEARGVGLLVAKPIDSARIHLVVDMGKVETDRLPPDHTTDIAGCTLPLLHKVESAYFAAAIRQYLLGGKAAC